LFDGVFFDTYGGIYYIIKYRYPLVNWHIYYRILWGITYFPWMRAKHA
jgi:hypothetical protein